MHVWHCNSDCNLLVFNQIQYSIQDVCLSFTVPSQELPPTGRIGPLKFRKTIGLLSFKISNKQFYSQKMLTMLILKHFLLFKRMNVGHYELKLEIFVKQGWYNEYSSIEYLKCNDTFTLSKNFRLKMILIQTLFKRPHLLNKTLRDLHYYISKTRSPSSTFFPTPQ